ncbi:MAG: FimV/HubP family polar landmark protein [Candidatus Thiodiazotropha sp.]
MTVHRTPLGELDVLIMGKVLPIRRAPVTEQRAIAEALIEQMNARISRRFGFQLEFNVIEIRDGCIRVKFALALCADPDTAATAVARYPEFKAAVKALWDDADLIEYMASGRACSARFTAEDLIDRLYGPVPEGHSLPQIAAELDSRDATREQLMIALFNANREQFIDDNLNLIRVGSILVIPDPAAISAISVQRANMQVMKHQRRFETRQRSQGDSDPA